MSNEATIVISAVDKTEAALKNIQGNVAQLEGGFTRLGGIVSGFAALAGVSAFTGIISGAIDSAASLNDLAQQTGATVESLSAMKGAAKIAGVEMDQVAGGLGKLSKNMLDASNGTGNAAKVFDVLGIKVTDANGRLKSSDAVMLEFAKSLQTISSGSERAAAAQLVLGKSGAQLMPMLNDMAIMGDLHAKVTTEQAAAADNLSDNMIRLSTVGNAWKTTVAMEIVPAADIFVKSLLDISTQADGTKRKARELAEDGSIQEWAISAAKAAGFVIDAFDGVGRAVSVAGNTIGAGLAQFSALREGDFSRVGQIGRDWQEKLSSIADATLFSRALADRLDEFKKNTAAYAEQVKIVRKAYEDAGSSAEVVEGAVKRLHKSMLGEGWEYETSKTKSLAGALDDTKTAADKAAKALANLHLDQMALLHKQAAAELDALAKAEEDYAKAVDALISPLEKQALSLEQQVEFYGMTESAIQSTIVSRLEEARVLAKDNGAWDQHLAFLDREIEARKRIGSAASQKEFLDSNKRAAEEASREWQRIGDDVERILSDSLMRGFEKGKSFGENFTDSLEASLKTLAIKVALNFTTSTGGNLLNAGLNYLAGSGGANGGSGVNYLGLASNASSAYNLANGTYAGYAAGAYSYGSTALGYTYETSALSQQSMMLAAQDSGLSSSSLSSSAYSGYLAIIAGWLMSHEAWKNGIVWNNDYSFTNNPERSGVHGWEHEKQYRINSDLFGEDFAKSEWAQTLTFSALSQQLSNWIFGSTSVRSNAVQGQFTNDGFSGANVTNMHKGGGWFGGGRDWQLFGELPEGVDAAFDGMYKSIKGSMLDLGLVFSDTGLADKLNNFKLDIYDITDGKSFYTVATEVSNSLMENIGKSLFPSIEALKRSASEDGKVLAETWNQAFTRITQESYVVSRTLSLMGKEISSVFGKNNSDVILKSSDALVNLFGSIDALNSSFNSYYQNFFSQEEQTKQAWDDMQSAFDRLGKTMPTTREGFRSLVDSLDLSTDAGRGTFASLMSLQTAFAALTPAIADMSSAQTAATAAAVAAAKRMAEDVAKSLLSGFDAALSDSRTFADSGLTALREAAQLERDRATAARDAASEQLASLKSMMDLLDNSATSLRGDTAAAGSLSAASAAWLRQAADTAATSGYLPDSDALAKAISSAQAGLNGPYASTFDRDFARLSLAGDLDRLKETAGKQLPVAERALATADAQLLSIDESVRLAEKQVNALLGIDDRLVDMSGSLESMTATLPTSIKQNFDSINATLLTAVQSGTIGSAEAASRMTGVAKDTAVNIGGQTAFMSSKGAIATKGSDGQVSITSNSGWHGSVADAKSALWQAYSTKSAAEFYAAAVGEGVSSAMIAAMFGIPQQNILDWAKANGLPAFAQGANRIPQDMLALVHRDEAIVPAAYNPALGNGVGNARLEMLVEAMTVEIQRLNADLADMRRDTRRTANAVNGNPEQPMLVETV